MLKPCKTIAFVLLALTWNACSPKQDTQTATTTDPWLLAKEIETTVTAPVFPALEIKITEHGAQPGGEVLCTEAIAAAIKACAAAGGGRVTVPAGIFLTGAIHLESNVNLHLEEGAELRFSTQPKDYLPLVHTSFEGTELMNYSPLIYAYQKKNIAITGKGLLNGQAKNENWWFWKGHKDYGWTKGMPSQLDSANRERLVQMAEDSVPVEQRIFGDGHYLRPTFIQPFMCENVWIQGVKIIDAPFWIVHPLKCTNVLVEDLEVVSHGPNNDGCDPEYCKNVVIRNTLFNTGDDCIAIKAGRDADGRRVAIPSENILVKNCKMIDGHGGVVIGSEISASVRNVFVEDCVMDSPNLDRAIRIKTNSNRGGVIENVYVRNLEVGQVKEAVLKLNMFYAAYAPKEGTFIPVIRNIYLTNVRVKKGGYFAILAKGYEQSPITNVQLQNVVIENADQPYSLENVKDLKMIDTYINGTLMQSEDY